MDSWQSFSAMGSYYCYRVHMNRNYEYDISFSDILLVVKSDLGSDFTSVELFLQTDRGEVSVNVEYDGVIHLSAEQVSMARRYQVCILKILMTHDHSKVMDALNGVNQGEHNTITAYLLLPSARGKHGSAIDWACVRSALFSLEVPHSNGMVGCLATKHCSIHSEDHQIRMKNGLWCHCMIKNSIVYTPHSGLMYCVTGILDNLNGNSTLKLRGGNELTYKEYYEERHGIILSHEGESLLAGRHIFPVQNWLHRHPFKKEKDSTNSSVELPPELCVIIMSPLSISTLYSFSFIPSIMHRLESVLLAFGLKKLQLDHYMQNDIPTLMVLEALTTKKCQEAFSLESLETLGDSFLKYAASQQLFRSYPYHHEGLLSAKKDQMVSNIALYKLGCERELPGYIRCKPFDPKNWSIPGEYLGCIGDNKFVFSKAKNIYNKGTKYIKYKVVSDVAEALIGAYLSTGGEVAALYFLKWLGLEVDFSNKVPDDASFLARPETYININFLESLLNYSFHNPCLLVEALTHGSYLVQDIPRCYQRLEFLGDAALDYLMTVHLYNKYPGLSPGFLTDLRSASVNNSCYAHAAVKVGLNKHILHASAELHRHIKSYLSNFGQSFLGSSYGWDAGTAAPKVLGDVIESLAGAILVDSRYDKDVVWKSIRPLLEPLVSPDTIKYHPVKELEYICRRKSYLHTLSKSHENGVASFTAEVEADGAIYRETRTGKNKKEAKALAAEAMLKFLKDRHLSSLL
ncbi:hypothetical protein QJS10_CPB04g00009 [Acorus calamus]|uniref:Uncharacterized protein n=1 Tax=Acorus calamus TaxID=4465 RepID=A0AAV9F186_ACOCL|nr:hypothetical protein QJS10_CPB04g00009 [Acorus calamus]